MMPSFSNNKIENLILSGFQRMAAFSSALQLQQHQHQQQQQQQQPLLPQLQLQHQHHQHVNTLIFFTKIIFLLNSFSF